MSGRKPQTKVQYQLHTSPEALKDVYERWVRGGVVRGRDGQAPVALESHIDELVERLSDKLRSGSHRFTTYKGVLVSKGAGKSPRLVSVPSARDRIVLRTLHDVLAEIYPENRTAIPQARVAEVAADLGAGSSVREVVRLDVENFYPSVSHDRLMSALRGRIRYAPLLTHINRAVATVTAHPGESRARVLQRRSTGARGVGIPQGLSVSNALAELVASPADRAIERACFGEKVHRFVDDAVILVDIGRGQSVFKAASQAYRARGLTIHPQAQSGKSYVCRSMDGFDFLGYTFDGQGGIGVRPASVHKLEASMARACGECASSAARGDALKMKQSVWALNLLVTGCTFKHEARGWLAYYRQMNDLTLLKRLDVTMSKLAVRYGLGDTFGPTFRVKSFLRAYYSMGRGQSSRGGYIPDYDDLQPADIRRHLIEIGAVDGAALASMTDLTAETLFYDIVTKRVAHLERDVGHLS